MTTKKNGFSTSISGFHAAVEGLMITLPRCAAIALFSLVCVVAPGSAQAPASLPSVQLPPPLARVLTDYEAAWARKDAAALASLFAEDGFVLSNGAPPVRGRAGIQKHYAGAGGPLSLRALAFATSGDVGYIIGAFATRKGAADAGKFTLTLKKDGDGRWLIMSDTDNGNSRGPGPGSAAVGEALPRATPESLGLAPARLQEATDLLRRFVTEGKIAGAVAGVARKGKLAYLEAAGYQDLESRTPMTPRSLFRIYSMTKSITAVAVMMLHEEGRFSLTDPVSKYLPEFQRVTVFVSGESGPTRPPAREVTVEDLLLHTAGLNHRTSHLYERADVRSRAITLPAFVANITRVPLMEDPHTKFRYSEATTVLGRLVEIWSGQPFDAFLDERVFQPLKMIDTGFWARPEQHARLTRTYATTTGGLTPRELEAVPFTERPTLIEGAVGLVSTVPDYLRFSQMLLNKGELDGVRILKATTVETMTANGLPHDMVMVRAGTGWGLANVNVAPDGEYGWDGTAGTIFWIDPAKEMVIVLMTQIVPPNPDSVRQRFKTFVKESLVP
jgi:CubicO group peptidase (beta-lactamase class C family)/ketosteroid isomerase-like protein